MRNPRQSFGLRQIISCVLVIVLTLTLLPLLQAKSVAPLQSQQSPSFPNWTAWQAYVTNLTTPGGCWVANFPNAVWQPTRCGTPRTEPMTVGSGVYDMSGHDWDALAPSGKIIGRSIGTLSTSGLTSENVGGWANSYSLQINSNYGNTFGFPVTFHGNKVPGGGWQQFIYLNLPSPPNPSSFGEVYIEYWLLGYYATYGKCPPASQDPPGGGTGWLNNANTDCYLNTAPVDTPFEPATNLGLLTFIGFANSHPEDGATLCISGGACYLDAVNGKPGALNLYKHWSESEFNVLGNCCATQAIFNSGTTIHVKNTLQEAGKPFGLATCHSGGATAETNNLNLGSCSSGKTYISFTESN